MSDFINLQGLGNKRGQIRTQLLCLGWAFVLTNGDIHRPWFDVFFEAARVLSTDADKALFTDQKLA